METTRANEESTLKGAPIGGALLGRDYNEADIAWLESQDLAESTVVTALLSAYEQNDPTERGFVGFRASPMGHKVGAEDELRERIAKAEEALRTNPKDYDTRVKRLMAMSGLALHAKVKAETAAASA